jgi:hypothetical protein
MAGKTNHRKLLFRCEAMDGVHIGAPIALENCYFSKNEVKL